MSKATKPTKPAYIHGVTNSPEERERQAQIYLANEKKNYFQIILASLLQNTVAFPQSYTADVIVQKSIDAALDGADYAITKLYSVEKKED